MNLRNSDVLLLKIKNKPNTKTAQTNTRATESVDFKPIKTIDTSYSIPKSLLQEETYLTAVTKKKSVFQILL